MRWVQIRSWQEIALQALRNRVTTFAWVKNIFRLQWHSAVTCPLLQGKARPELPGTCTHSPQCTHSQLQTQTCLNYSRVQPLTGAGSSHLCRFTSVQPGGAKEVRMKAFIACSQNLSLLWALQLHSLLALHCALGCCLSWAEASSDLWRDWWSWLSADSSLESHEPYFTDSR